MDKLYSALLRDFCRLDCDRFEFIRSFLERIKVPYSILQAGGRHILVTPRSQRPPFKDHYRKILTAHYDRMPGTYGANDNSAAVVILLKHILQLQSLDYAHNTLVLFTDKEELYGGDTIENQGAWNLVKSWPANEKSQVFCLTMDMCGVGDTLIWGRLDPRVPQEVAKTFVSIQNFIKRILFHYSHRENLDVNTMISDDLSFLFQDIPALRISTLPFREAKEWKSIHKELDKLQGLSELNEEINSLAKDIAGPKGAGATQKPPEPQAKEKESRRVEALKKHVPPSWESNHSIEDTVESLDDKAFSVMESFLMEFSRCQIPIRSE